VRGVEVGLLGERRGVERHAAALRHQLRELRAQARFQDGDVLLPH
jgi:hypothetical protein